MVSFLMPRRFMQLEAMHHNGMPFSCQHVRLSVKVEVEKDAAPLGRSRHAS